MFLKANLAQGVVTEKSVVLSGAGSCVFLLFLIVY